MCIICSRHSIDRVPANLESQGESGKVAENFVGDFVGIQGKIACIVRLSSCCCNVVSGKKCDVLFWIIWIGFLLCYFKIESASIYVYKSQW